MTTLLMSGCVSNCTTAKVPDTTASTQISKETPKQDIPAPKEPAAPAKKEEPKQEQKKEEVQVSLTTPKPEKKEEKKPVVEEKKPEPVAEKPKETPKPKAEQKTAEKKAADEEYERSVSQMEGKAVDVDTFNKDKEAVLALIDVLNEVMKTENFGSWTKYLDNESYTYWSKKQNLQKAQKRLPVKGLKLDTLEDYFKYVFIPARQGNKMDEIRYETEKIVKVVQIRKDAEGKYEGDTVYYNLRKESGVWKLHLPQM